MANIKVSEMTEATEFNNNDYTMIVQANQSKKISKANLFKDIPIVDTFSTDEVMTNKIWVDGKPIYRKAFSFTQWGGLGYDTGLTNIENIINSSVLLKNTETSQWRNLSYDTNGFDGYYIKKAGDTYKLLIQNNSVYTADSICAYIEYTKIS